MARQQISCDHPEDDGRLYQVLVREVPAFAIFLVDKSGCIASWNEGVGQILRYGEDEFIGKPFSILFIPEDQSAGAPEAEMTRAARDRRSEDERWHVRKDGARFWCDGVLTSLKTQDGELLGFAKIMRDSTRRKQAEDALKENQERLEAALAASRTGTFRWDMRTDALLWDDNLHRLFGLESGRTVHYLQDFLALVHPDDRARVAEASEHSRRDLADFDCEYRAILPDGSRTMAARPRKDIRWREASGPVHDRRLHRRDCAQAGRRRALAHAGGKGPAHRRTRRHPGQHAGCGIRRRREWNPRMQRACCRNARVCKQGGVARKDRDAG